MAREALSNEKIVDTSKAVASWSPRKGTPMYKSSLGRYYIVHSGCLDEAQDLSLHQAARLLILWGVELPEDLVEEGKTIIVE